jgi:hypothetical protein
MVRGGEYDIEVCGNPYIIFTINFATSTVWSHLQIFSPQNWEQNRNTSLSSSSLDHEAEVLLRRQGRPITIASKRTIFHLFQDIW